MTALCPAEAACETQGRQSSSEELLRLYLALGTIAKVAATTGISPAKVWKVVSGEGLTKGKPRGAFKDLTGKTFGHLKVLRRSQNSGHHTCWLCVCSCGKELPVTARALIAGKKTSCGCIPDKSRRLRDLTGRTFGHLKVLRRSERTGKDTWWLCSCDCGKELQLRSPVLLAGKTSCGCRLHKRLWKRRKFAALRILSGPTYRDGEQWYRCNCECGVQTDASRHELIAGIKEDCGCGRGASEPPTLDQQQQAARLYAAWTPPSIIAQRLKLKPAQIPHLLAAAGIDIRLRRRRSRPRLKRKSDEVQAKAVHLYDRGLTFAAVAKQLGIASSTARRYVKKAQHATRHKRYDDDVRGKAARLYLSGFTYKSVGKELGIHQTSARKFALEEGLTSRPVGRLPAAKSAHRQIEGQT